VGHDLSLGVGLDQKSNEMSPKLTADALHFVDLKLRIGKTNRGYT
jgi:hypothetical protein